MTVFLWLLLPLLLFLSFMMMMMMMMMWESTKKYLMEIKCVCWEKRRRRAFVAQGLEHWSRKPGVESSILSEGKEAAAVAPLTSAPCRPAPND